MMNEILESVENEPTGEWKTGIRNATQTWFERPNTGLMRPVPQPEKFPPKNMPHKNQMTWTLEGKWPRL